MHTALGRLVLKNEKGKSAHFTGRGVRSGRPGSKSIRQQARTAQLAQKVAHDREEGRNRHGGTAAQ